MKKFCFSILGTLALMFGLTSCNTGDVQAEDTMMTFDFTFGAETYNADGYWSEVYNPDYSFFRVMPGASFSHKAQVSVYDGVEYKSFTGFCPSIVQDSADHTGDDWTKFQFGAIAQSGGFGYLIAHWDVRETAQTTLSDRSCLIECFGYTFRPIAIKVTNTTYAYWAMKNGTAFSRPFGPDDYLILDIYGVNKGVATLGQSVELAKNGSFVDTWQQIDLTSLGDVQQIYFTMRSSDEGEYGMNVPAYFALGSLQFLLLGNQ